MAVLELRMIGSHFIAKSMILIFSIPLVSQSGIKLDLKPVEQFIASRQAEPVDTEQLKMAVQSLAITAQMNEKAAQNANTLQKADESLVQEDAQFAALMTNLQKLTEQAH